MKSRILVATIALLIVLALSTSGIAEVSPIESNNIAITRISRNSYRIARDSGTPLIITLSDKALAKMSPQDVLDFADGLRPNATNVVIYDITVLSEDSDITALDESTDDADMPDSEGLDINEENDG